MNIEVSFRTWQQLTGLLQDEHDSYDDVINRLISDACGNLPRRVSPSRSGGAEIGAVYKGVFLPEGTVLRSNYKGKTFYGEIKGSDWVDVQTGETRTSPSQAAYSITGSGVNGWLFWLVKRPKDTDWLSLNELRSGGAG